MSEDRLKFESLEALVEELIKENPAEDSVKAKMKENGIPYCSDPIARINLVLRALHFEENFEDKKGSK